MQMPGNNNKASGSTGTAPSSYNANAGNAPVPEEHPIAAPKAFQYLDEQLNKMDRNISNEANEEPQDTSANPVTRSINAITRETRKVVKQLVIPGVASVGAASVGYVLLLGRTMYSAAAMLLGLGLGSQPLDPATLLEYWEREGSKRRDDREKKVESMFG